MVGSTPAVLVLSRKMDDPAGGSSRVLSSALPAAGLRRWASATTATFQRPWNRCRCRNCTRLRTVSGPGASGLPMSTWLVAVKSGW